MPDIKPLTALVNSSSVVHAARWSETSALALSDRRFSASKIAMLLDIGLEAGLDSDAILEGTQLDTEAIRNPLTLTSAQQFLVASRNALQLYTGDDLGLRLGSLLHAPSYGMYGYALLCAETLRQGFDWGMKYHRLSSSVISAQVIEEGELVSFVYRSPDTAQSTELDQRLYRFLVEFQLTVAATLVADVMGPWCLPAQVTFAFPEPTHAELFSRILQCPVLFEQPRHMLSYPLKWLSKAPRMANPIDAARMSAECTRLMDEIRQHAGVTRQVYQELMRNPGRFPDIDSIAETLHVTARTLRRKLELEGTSYRELLNSTRKALAIDYLSTTLMNTEDIARSLGFSDPVSFRHAFKRWTGQSPFKFRQTRQPRS